MPFFNPMQNQQNLLDELSRRLFQERGMYGGGMGGGMQPTANLGGNPIANAVSNISGMSLSPMERAISVSNARGNAFGGGTAFGGYTDGGNAPLRNIGSNYGRSTALGRYTRGGNALSHIPANAPARGLR